MHFDIDEFLAKMRGKGSWEKGAITGKTFGIGILLFLIVTCIPLLYVQDVLVGKEYFPYPDLLLNIIAMYLIVFSTVSGKLLMHKGEKRVANIIGVNTISSML